MIAALILLLASAGTQAARFNAPPVSKIAYDDAVLINRQRLESMPACRIQFRITSTTNYEPLIAFYQAQLNELKQKRSRLSPQEQMKTEAVYAKRVKDLENRMAKVDLEPNEGVITWSRNGLEVQWSSIRVKGDQPAKLDPGSSFTGGFHSVAKLNKLDQNPRWVILDPYPLKGTTQPVYGVKSGSLRLNIALVPAMLNYDSIFTVNDHNLESIFFGQSATPSVRGSYSISQNAGLITRDEGERVFSAASLSLNRGASPDWIGQFAVLDDPSEKLSDEKAKALVDAVPQYRSSEVITNPAYACPLEIMWFDDWKPISGVLYPHKVTFRHFIWQPIGGQGDKSSKIFTSFENTLEVTNATPITPEANSFQSQIPDRARVVDEDKGVSNIVGEKPDETTGRMLAVNRPESNRRLFLIIANILLLLVFGYILFRRYRRARTRPDNGQASATPSVNPPPNQ
jgi:hypothetical protein